jgi:hypothetical protein
VFIANSFREGNHGPWSTFDIEIGTPAQKIAVVPAFSLNEVWLWSRNLTTCPNSDTCTSVFSVNQSSTWRNWNKSDGCASFFRGSGYTAPAVTVHGKDIGSVSINPPTESIHGPVAARVVSSYKRPELGYLGLNAPPECFGNDTSSSPSFVSAIKDEVAKRNLSWIWSYTAGRYNGWCRLEQLDPQVTDNNRWFKKHKCQSNLWRL